MSYRCEVAKTAGKCLRKLTEKISPTKLFESQVFNLSIMKEKLPQKIYQNILDAIAGKEKIDLAYADEIASAMKNWAISHGATHYTHWFQPMTGGSAQKHESFLVWKNRAPFEEFSGKQLLQGEPDASSFPSGGLRSTYEARGYTIWDPASPPFIWKNESGSTLCIPSYFFSWNGKVLDNKIPLLRSEKKLEKETLRLVKLFKEEASFAHVTLGLEQEYFVISHFLRNLRPDLVMLEKTVFGAAPAKGQELEDHYFGSLKEKVFAFMKEFEDEALRLGIPVQTRHNEVAPAQHEVTPLFERASLSIDHNLLLMELMRQTAIRHDLTCLLHEKPFAHVNGSGKHSNWSISTDRGLNLLDPTNTPPLIFLTILTATLHAVYKHAKLLRASIGSAGNDYRLGGSEAPPVIVSIYLGETLESFLNEIENEKLSKLVLKTKSDFQIPSLPEIPKDNTDRNRTSFFAFTGNKFEFRAVGASANPSFPIAVLNAIVASSLHLILNDLEKEISKSSLELGAITVLKKYLLESHSIRFSGDNYSSSWEKEAEKRGLPHIKKSYPSFASLKEALTMEVFKDILTAEELESRYEILVESYIKTTQIEIKLMIEMFYSQILPAALKHQGNIAKALSSLPKQKLQKEYLEMFSSKITKAIEAIEELVLVKNSSQKLSADEKGKLFCEKACLKMEKARKIVDELELYTDDELWPLPKYKDLLFLI